MAWSFYDSALVLLHRCIFNVVGGVDEGYDRGEFTHTNPSSLVLGSSLVESL